MLFSWTDGTPKTLRAEGSMAPEHPVRLALDQKGSTLRTPIGGAMSRAVYSKWALSVSWMNTPDSVATSVHSMVSSGAQVTFEDASIGTYTMRLSAADMREEPTKMGLTNVDATFRQV